MNLAEMTEKIIADYGYKRIGYDEALQALIAAGNERCVAREMLCIASGRATSVRFIKTNEEMLEVLMEAGKSAEEIRDFFESRKMEMPPIPPGYQPPPETERRDNRAAILQILMSRGESVEKIRQFFNEQGWEMLPIPAGYRPRTIPK
jgi:hypothetical protein